MADYEAGSDCPVCGFCWVVWDGDVPDTVRFCPFCGVKLIRKNKPITKLDTVKFIKGYFIGDGL